jgi:hypothetical protein
MKIGILTTKWRGKYCDWKNKIINFRLEKQAGELFKEKKEEIFPLQIVN